MHKWSHLVNARHIDWVIESLNSDPRFWCETWYEVDHEIWDESWTVARDIIKQDPDLQAAWQAACDKTWEDQTQYRFREPAWGAILALMAWDDSDRYLNLNLEQLEFIAVLSERPEAVLLLPMVYMRERIHA